MGDLVAAAAAVALDDGEVGGGQMQISSLLVLRRPEHDHGKRKDARRAGRQGGDPGHTEGLPNRYCGKNDSAAHTGGGLHTGTASHCFKQSSSPPFSNAGDHRVVCAGGSASTPARASSPSLPTVGGTCRTAEVHRAGGRYSSALLCVRSCSAKAELDV